jgi:VIT1/CCC1 family predicted Fe2+/Mn2+ transporter
LLTSSAGTRRIGRESSAAPARQSHHPGRQPPDPAARRRRPALGSPWGAAATSLLTLAIGAFVVVVPYLFGGGTAALLTAIGLAVAALFAVGATIGAVNGRSVLRSGLRQVGACALAAGITFGVGHLIGTRRPDRTATVATPHRGLRYGPRPSWARASWRREVTPSFRNTFLRW